MREPSRAPRTDVAGPNGKREVYGSKIERLVRSTLETWMYGTAKTKARDVIARIRSTLETWMYGTAKTKARDVIARIIEVADKVQP